MAVKLRMTRTGGRNDACYRVVAADKRSPRDGRFIEILGWYDPKRTDPNFYMKMDRVEHWIAQGAELSETVRDLVNEARRGGGAPAPAETAPAAESVAAESVEPEEAAAAPEEAPEAAESETAADVQAEGAEAAAPEKAPAGGAE